MASIKVADEVWVATALLHRSYPDREDFTVAEIVEQARIENATGTGCLRRGIRPHIYLHCIAHKPPDRGRYRMLVETSQGYRRLWRPGDLCHRKRINGKYIPHRGELPAGYRFLIEWYRRDYANDGGGEGPTDE